MNTKQNALFFDKYDYELLEIVNEVLTQGAQAQTLRSLLIKHMHPHGIKEMAAPRGLRIAYAIASLLGSFEKGKASDRIDALRSLTDEILLANTSYFQKNTARVLLQIMKELLRSRSNTLLQLKLAHDFRMASAGNPRLVRKELAKYHLLEMPEEWNQYAFDDHVHDANTKGRKSPTHLVMDAWIKGIRYLTVVYYNYVSPDVVEELLEASAILDIRVQIGIEVSSLFRDKYVRFTWEPSGLSDSYDFLKFLNEAPVRKLMEQGKHVSHYQQRYVFAVLDSFNKRHLPEINRETGLSLDPLQLKDFLDFVGSGQPSVLHLAKFIQNALTTLQTELNQENSVPQKGTLHILDVADIIERFLLPLRNPEVHDPSCPSHIDEVPDLLKLSPEVIIGKLKGLHTNSNFVLNLNNLSVQDCLELLYTCKGMISHIEAYNLKTSAHGIHPPTSSTSGALCGAAVDLQSPIKFYSLVSNLQKALSEDNVISLKRAIRAIIWDQEERRYSLHRHLELLPDDKPDKPQLKEEFQQMVDRKDQLLDILYNLESFHNFYKKKTLGSRIGSGSTGQVEHQYGMGMVVVDTLPAKAQKIVNVGLGSDKRSSLPVSALLTKNSHTARHGKISNRAGQIFAKNLPYNGAQKWEDWSLDGILVHPETAGNIVTLGGLTKNGEVSIDKEEKCNSEKIGNPWRYLNTNLKNSLKVLIGFIPAFLTFYLTKEWWLLAYMGAFIWFGITGSRNIIQSVAGGGGLRRSPLLPWNSLVSWSRISDSLLYTGFSVPLLDFLVKTILLDNTLGITTATNPILLYAVMGLANGIYISSHNIFRGLPRSAAVGNFFRSILAIPLAVLLNSVIGACLSLYGIPDVSLILQKWAAIISKFASDCVAAIIEGLADRQINIRSRLREYRTKMSQLFSVFSRLDLFFPEEDVLDMLQSPKITMETLNYEAREQEKYLIVNALDLMYFWMYQPRARKALKLLYAQMSEEEWLIFYRSQLVLKRQREISQVVVDGLVGKNFAKALSFYLDRADEYLADLEKLGSTGVKPV